MSIESAVKICQTIDWTDHISTLDGQLKESGFTPLDSSRPGLRRDYDYQGVRVSVMENPEKQGFYFLEFYLELMMDKSHLMEEPSQYEVHAHHYRELWDRGCAEVEKLMGPPAFRGNWEEDDFPEASPAAETAAWNLGKAQLRLEYRDDGPELPSWLSLVVAPV